MDSSQIVHSLIGLTQRKLGFWIVLYLENSDKKFSCTQRFTKMLFHNILVNHSS